MRTEFTIKNVILTGSSGFVGSRFIKDCHQQFHIRPLSLLKTPLKDVSFKDVDAIVHSAALVHQMIPRKEEDYFSINRDLTLSFAKAAKEKGVKHFLFLSTAHVFGDSGTLGDHKMRLSSSSPCQPKDAYGRSKLAAEEELLKLADPSFRVSILRPPMVYGEGAKGNILSLVKLVKRCPVLPLGYSKNKRSMIYIGNLTAFIKSTLLSDRAEGEGNSEILLPQDPQPISISQLVTLIAQALGKKVYLVPVPSIVVKILSQLNKKLALRLFGTLAMDSEESNRRLKFTPPFTTSQGLQQMLSGDNQ